jgi:hypothetical protein
VVGTQTVEARSHRGGMIAATTDEYHSSHGATPKLYTVFDR